jgi:2-keto-4-pentenoate hydratase/2-oxohepta-3-ene-1,7-dioic acid hydratase in catechol pathway
VRLIRFNNWQTGIVVTDHQFLDVVESLPAFAERDAVAARLVGELLGGPQVADWAPMIEQWEAAGPALSDLSALAQTGAAGIVLRMLTDVDLLPPLPSPRPRVFALGSNFADHGARSKTKILGRTVTEEEIIAEHEQGLPPWGFLVVPGTISGTGATLCPPAGVTMLDYEAEAAIVLRSGGSGIPAGDVAVWGYTGWNDLSIRDHFFGKGTAIDRGVLNWTLAKNFQGANPCGAWMCVDEAVDVQNLRMRSRVNGAVRQDSTTAKMIYSFAETVAHLSEYVTLLPGDMLTSGTPAGPAIEDGLDGAYLNPGDVVEIEIEGAGILRTIVGEPDVARALGGDA